jgi:MFS family permease
MPLRTLLTIFLTDWPKMINIWGTTFIVGPFLGPALAGYLADAMDWHDTFAVLVFLYAISTILVVAFGKETYYAPNRGSAPAPTFLQSITSRGGTLALYRPSFKLSSKITLKYIFVWPMLLCGNCPPNRKNELWSLKSTQVSP